MKTAKTGSKLTAGENHETEMSTTPVYHTGITGITCVSHLYITELGELERVMMTLCHFLFYVENVLPHVVFQIRDNVGCEFHLVFYSPAIILVFI